MKSWKIARDLNCEDLRRGKFTFQAKSVPVKITWCDLLRQWLRKWGKKPTVTKHLEKVNVRGQYNGVFMDMIIIMLTMLAIIIMIIIIMVMMMVMMVIIMMMKIIITVTTTATTTLIGVSKMQLQLAW